MCDVIEHLEETGPLLTEIERVGKKGWGIDKYNTF